MPTLRGRVQLVSDPNERGGMSLISKLRFALLVVSVPASQLWAQNAHPIGINRRDSAQQRTAPVQTLKSVLGSPYAQATFTAVGGAFAGGFAGWIVDQIYCKQRYGDKPSFIFSYCTLYIGNAAAIGWGGGSLVGATSKAAHLARKKGCPLSEAMGRAFAGAALGLTPAALIAAKSAPVLRAHETLFVAGAPVFSGLLAAAFVKSCHR